MKNLLRMTALVTCLSLFLVSCRDENKQNLDETTTEAAENMDHNNDGQIDDGESAANEAYMEADAKIKVKEDKIKMEDSKKEVKIKTDDGGAVKKVKVEYKDEGEN